VACGGPSGLNATEAAALGAKIAITGSTRSGIRETGAGGANGAREIVLAETQHVSTPSTCVR